MHHQFPHLLPSCAVLRIRRLFLAKQPRVLSIKTLDGGELLNAQRVKGLFGSPVQRDLVLMLEAVFRRVLEEHPEATADRAIKVLEACQVEEEDFFCHVTHKTWDVILHDIRKAHENDSESAPDTTPADELIREVQKAMQSPGDRVQQFTEIFCKAFRLKYKRLSQEERSLLKKLFKKSPLIKQSGMNFRRRPWK